VGLALPLEEFSRRLMRTVLSGRDICVLLHDVDFQQIKDRNSKTLLLRRFVVDECLVSMNNKMLADVYDISIGNVKKTCCIATRRREAEVGRVGHPPALTSEQDAEIVCRLLHGTS
jgi:hypothetical protein